MYLFNIYCRTFFNKIGVQFAIVYNFKYNLNM